MRTDAGEVVLDYNHGFDVNVFPTWKKTLGRRERAAIERLGYGIGHDAAMAKAKQQASEKLKTLAGQVDGFVIFPAVLNLDWEWDDRRGWIETQEVEIDEISPVAEEVLKK